MVMGEKETKKAEAQFKKVQAAKDAATGTALYAAEKNTVIARTAKLRAERLSREAETLAQPAEVKVTTRRKRSTTVARS